MGGVRVNYIFLKLRFFLERLPTWLILLSILLINLAIFLPQSRLDPDSHHDGYMFAGAVAFSEGKIPNRDFFAQYGPLTPIIQGTWLKVMGLQLVNLRFLTAIFLSLISLILYLLIQPKVGKIVAFLVQLSWALSLPRLPLPPALPWSSVISTLVLLFCIYNFRLAHGTNRNSIYRLVITGIMLSLAPLLRIQIWLFVLLISLNWVYLFLKKRITRLMFLSLTLPIVIVSLIIFMLMYATHSLDSFILQCIKWPRQFYGNTYLPSTIFTKEGLIYWSTWYYYPFYYVLIRKVLFSKRYLANVTFSSFDKRKFFLVLILSGYTVITLSLYNADVHPKSYLNPLLQFQWLAQRSLLAFFYFLAFERVLRFFTDLLRRRVLGNYFEYLLSLSAISQLYPGSDPLHLWWISPILLATFFTDAQEFYSVRKLHLVKFRNYLLLTVTLSLIILCQYLSIPRVGFSVPILRNMSTTVLERNELQTKIRLISDMKKQYPNSRMIFDCHDGIFAVANGTYLVADENFVNWGPRFNRFTKSGDIVFLCRTENSKYQSNYPTNEFLLLQEVRLIDGSKFQVLQKKHNG